MYAQVVVDVLSRQVDKPFTYAVPDGLSPALGMRVRVPFGKRELTGLVVGLCEEAGGLEPEKIKPLLGAVEDFPLLTEELIALARWLQGHCGCTLAQAVRAMLPAQLRGGSAKPLTRLAVRLCQPLGQALQASKRAPRQQQLLRSVSDGRVHRLDLLEEEIPGALAVARALEKKGICEVFSLEVRRAPFVDLALDQSHLPTAEQANAIAALSKALDDGGGSFLLAGVTGSGKTEVYMHLIRRCLNRGKGAIVLVPEIALTPQMAAWFRARFGDTAAILHSALSKGEQFDEWRRIRFGEARVVVGARSAVFAPVQSLGLVVVDEEHEQSYQSEGQPQYDARDVAVERARLCGGIALLGSATPQIQSYEKALRGAYTLLELPHRVQGRPMAQVEIVDMRREILDGNPSIFSRSLRRALEETLQKGEQAVLFINRRGYAGFVKCRACGYTPKCPHCDVALTFHLTDNSLHCHYCGYRQATPSLCPACGSRYIKPMGIGTQKVEQIFRQEFPTVPCIRLDADTTARKDELVRLLSSFRRGEAKVMIGTQMVAKGHDFPNVTLVGVMMADLSLNVPDYRSEERTFQLLTQVAGRAGRGELPGQVFVQTYEPDHYAIQMAARQDYRAFFEQELKRRKRTLYPPYTLPMRILATSPSEPEARAAAEGLGQQLKDWFYEEKQRRKLLVQVRAMEAPLSKIRDVYRYQVYVKLYAADGYAEALEQMQALCREYETAKVSLRLEIDPPSFL